MDLNFRIREEKSTLGLLWLGRNPNQMEGKTEHTHAAPSAIQDWSVNYYHCYTCPKMHYVFCRVTRRCKLDSMLLSVCQQPLRFSGLAKNPKLLVAREPMHQMLSDLHTPLTPARLWASRHGIHTISLANRHTVLLIKLFTFTLSSNAPFKSSLLKN